MKDGCVGVGVGVHMCVGTADGRTPGHDAGARGRAQILAPGDVPCQMLCVCICIRLNQWHIDIIHMNILDQGSINRTNMLYQVQHRPKPHTNHTLSFTRTRTRSPQLRQIQHRPRAAGPACVLVHDEAAPDADVIRVGTPEKIGGGRVGLGGRGWLVHGVALLAVNGLVENGRLCLGRGLGPVSW